MSVLMESLLMVLLTNHTTSQSKLVVTEKMYEC